MLVICEDCAKKYNIDESRIRGNRARFTCNECGHIIVVDKADFSRPLIRSSNQHKSPTSSIDLLKEMEAPLSSEQSSEDIHSGQQNEDAESSVDKAVIKNKGLTIISYFLIAGAISFVIVNAGIVFILSQHYTGIASQQMELHSGLLVTSVLVMLGCWIVSFAILYGTGAYLSKKVNNLAAAINRINLGENEFNVAVNGPKELTNITQVVSTLCSKIR